jgi:hypothetical protein
MGVNENIDGAGECNHNGVDEKRSCNSGGVAVIARWARQIDEVVMMANIIELQ